jgi:hypothetical protein
MRLHPVFVNYLAAQLVADLVKARKVRIEDERMIIGLVKNTILDDLEAEEALDDEAREVLKVHYDKMRAAGVSYDEMLRKVKAQLAKEKGIVL